MSEIKRIQVDTAGYSRRDQLTANVGRAECGQIKDGVGFEHDSSGGWVVAFADLERIYLANKAFREGEGAPPKKAR